MLEWENIARTLAEVEEVKEFLLPQFWEPGGFISLVPSYPCPILASCWKSIASTYPGEPPHAVSEPLIYRECLPQERNVIGHFSWL